MCTTEPAPGVLYLSPEQASTTAGSPSSKDNTTSADTTHHTAYAYGLHPVPAQFPSPYYHSLLTSTILPASPLRELHAADIGSVPDTPLARRIDAYAKEKLPPQTYRHSRRVFAWGCAVVMGTEWGRRAALEMWEGEVGIEELRESWFLTAMLHDIGTPEMTLQSTRLSYEFWAGFHTLQILQDASLTGSGNDEDGVVAPREQAESVAEAILRHQDVQDKGNVTLLTRMIHIGTLLDNIGKGSEMVSRKTVENVVREWPRTDANESVWSDCFRGTVEMEKKHKPYAMVSRIEGFEDLIAKNGARGGLFEAWETAPDGL